MTNEQRETHEVIAAATAASLRVDVQAARVLGALEAAGIDALLLKGASLAWLYPDVPRQYIDVDVLVAPDRFADAGRVLADLGLVNSVAGRAATEFAPHSVPWRDGARPEVDLHRTLSGATADPGVVWAALWRNSAPVEVAGASCRALTRAAGAMHVALHAAQGTVTAPRVVEDLQRALDAVDEGTWRAAAGLAREIGAAEAMSAGLRVLPAAAAVADSLGLDDPASLALALANTHGSGPAMSMARLFETPGVAAKAALVGRVLVPTRALMETRYRLARRGAVGLTLAYVVRVLIVLGRAPGAAAAIVRARLRR